MTTASHCGTEKPTHSYLNEKVPELQVTQNLVHDLQALSIRYHRVELASDVKILGHRKKQGAIQQHWHRCSNTDSTLLLTAVCLQKATEMECKGALVLANTI